MPSSQESPDPVRRGRRLARADAQGMAHREEVALTEPHYTLDAQLVALFGGGSGNVRN